MLLMTYQPKERNKDKTDQEAKALFGFDPVWCMPAEAPESLFAHSVCCAPNMAEKVCFVETDGFTRIDKIRHYACMRDQKPMDEDIIDGNMDDAHSEIVISETELERDTVLSADIRGIRGNGMKPLAALQLDGTAKEHWLRATDLTEYSLILGELKKYEKLEPAMDTQAKNDALTCFTERELKERLQRELDKYVFERTLLCLFQHLAKTRKLDIRLLDACHMNETLHKRSIGDIGRWNYGDCTKPRYDAIFHALESSVATEPKLRMALLSGHKPGRNDKCPCGSGLKYKKCHGIHK